VHLICNKTESASVLTSKLGIILGFASKLGIILGFAFVTEIGERKGCEN